MPTINFDGLSDAVEAQWRTADEALHQDPRDAHANARLAMLLHAYAQFPEAHTLYQRARTLQPDNADWAWYHGLLLRRMGRVEAARAAFQEATRLDPTNAAPALQLALSADRPEIVREMLNRVIRLAPHEGHAYLMLAQHWLDGGQPEKAAGVLQHGLEQAGNFGALHYALATALRNTGAPEDEVTRHLDLHRRHLDARLDANDELPPALRTLNLAEAASQRARRAQLERAVEDLEAQRQARPGDGFVHANLMVLHGRLLQVDAARAAYERAARLLPDDASVHFAAGNIELLAHRNRQALAAYERSLAVAPEFDDAQVQLGQANERLARDEAAIEHYRAVLARTPTHPLAGALLARRLVIRGAFDDPWLRKIEVADDAPQGWQWRVKAARLQRAGDAAGALAAARRGLQLSVAARDHEVSAVLQQQIATLATSSQ